MTGSDINLNLNKILSKYFQEQAPEIDECLLDKLYICIRVSRFSQDQLDGIIHFINNHLKQYSKETRADLFVFKILESMLKNMYLNESMFYKLESCLDILWPKTPEIIDSDNLSLISSFLNVAIALTESDDGFLWSYERFVRAENDTFSLIDKLLNREFTYLITRQKEALIKNIIVMQVKHNFQPSLKICLKSYLRKHLKTIAQVLSNIMDDYKSKQRIAETMDIKNEYFGDEYIQILVFREYYELDVLLHSIFAELTTDPTKIKTTDINNLIKALIWLSPCRHGCIVDRLVDLGLLDSVVKFMASINYKGDFNNFFFYIVSKKLDDSNQHISLEYEEKELIDSQFNDKLVQFSLVNIQPSTLDSIQIKILCCYIRDNIQNCCRYKEVKQSCHVLKSYAKSIDISTTNLDFYNAIQSLIKSSIESFIDSNPIKIILSDLIDILYHILQNDCQNSKLYDINGSNFPLCVLRKFHEDFEADQILTSSLRFTGLIAELYSQSLPYEIIEIVWTKIGFTYKNSGHPTVLSSLVYCLIEIDKTIKLEHSLKLNIQKHITIPSFIIDILTCENVHRDTIETILEYFDKEKGFVNFFKNDQFFNSNFEKVLESLCNIVTLRPEFLEMAMISIYNILNYVVASEQHIGSANPQLLAKICIKAGLFKVINDICFECITNNPECIELASRLIPEMVQKQPGITCNMLIVEHKLIEGTKFDEAQECVVKKIYSYSPKYNMRLNLEIRKGIQVYYEADHGSASISQTLSAAINDVLLYSSDSSCGGLDCY